jgi:hypothetical protein
MPPNGNPFHNTINSFHSKTIFMHNYYTNNALAFQSFRTRIFRIARKVALRNLRRSPPQILFDNRQPGIVMLFYRMIHSSRESAGERTEQR